MFRGKSSSRLGPENQEARYKFGIDPVGLGAGSKAAREGLDLGWRHLAGFDACILQMEPEPPFLPARRFETNDGSLVVSEIGHRDMAIVGIGDTMALTVRETMNVMPRGSDVAHHPATGPGQAQ